MRTSFSIRMLIGLALLGLALGGCLSDADTGRNRSVLPTMTSPKPGDRDDADGGKRQLCEDTVVGGAPKTVCY